MTSDVPILDFLGEKYLEWKVGVSTYLTASGLQDTLVEGNTTTSQEKAKAIIFLRRHIHESLKYEFLFLDDPKDLWDSLNKRYGSKLSFLFSKALDDWKNLRFQDYDSVSEYNCTLCRITSQLELYGEKIDEESKLRKTFSTMHPSNMKVSQECVAAGYAKHTDLIFTLLVYEECGKLVMRNPCVSNQSLAKNATVGKGSTNRVGPVRRQGPRRGYNYGIKSRFQS